MGTAFRRIVLNETYAGNDIKAAAIPRQQNLLLHNRSLGFLNRLKVQNGFAFFPQ
jgi:hypothetical protein